MFYIKKFLHKPHSQAASPHCLCHELLSCAVAAVCIIALKAWPGQLDVYKELQIERKSSHSQKCIWEGSVLWPKGVASLKSSASLGRHSCYKAEFSFLVLHSIWRYFVLPPTRKFLRVKIFSCPVFGSPWCERIVIEGRLNWVGIVWKEEDEQVANIKESPYSVRVQSYPVEPLWKGSKCSLNTNTTRAILFLPAF